jgi:hypothetical protein
MFDVRRRDFITLLGGAYSRKMISRNIVQKRLGPTLIRNMGLTYYGFFDSIITEDGTMLGEDFSFCKRWVEQCSGEIWAFIEGRVSHHGPFRFFGTYADKLRANRV